MSVTSSSRRPGVATTMQSPTGTNAAPSPSITVQLPSKTIVALGLGFVGAALLVVVAMILLRLNQARLTARRARASGDDVTFRQVWDRWGGFWGLFFVQNDERDTLGQRLVRVRSVHIPLPRMWEVPLDVKALRPRDEFALVDAQPLAAVPYTADNAPEEAPDEIAFSVLILLPSPPPTTDPDEPEVPDLMLGTCHVMLTQPLDKAGIEPMEQSDKASITEIEFVPPPRRRASSAPHWSIVWGLEGGRVP